MPFQVDRIPGKNIILLKASGQLSAAQVQAVYREIADLLSSMDGSVYRITDVGDQTMTYDEMLRIIDLAVSGNPGSLTDPRIKNIWVGRGFYAMQVRELLRDRGLVIPLFGTMEEALAAVEKMLENQSPPATDEDNG